jgi:two-component system, chemotaxis family, protein-glutamate methylesterase/glutaminase
VASQIIVIGTSFGGLNALQVLLAGLPKDFPVPIAVVQHRGKNSDDGLCEYLQMHSKLIIKEPEDKESVKAGNVYIAPSDYHLLIDEENFALSTEAPVWYARPSIDVLFESAADTFKEKTTGIILTGANKDGAKGLSRIKAYGGLAIVEDPSTAKSSVMPEAAIEATKVDQILPLAGIATYLVNLYCANNLKMTSKMMVKDKTNNVSHT